MSLQLNLDELLETLSEIESPEFQEIKEQVEAAANRASAIIANHFDCNCGEASFEGIAFAGTCVLFRPKYAGQDCPKGLSQYDDGGADEWENDLDELTGAI